MTSQEIAVAMLNSVSTSDLQNLGIIQSEVGDNVFYDRNGTKLTVVNDSHPTQYQKDDGTIIFASDIIANYYNLDKTEEFISDINAAFIADMEEFHRAERRRKQEQEEQERLQAERERQERYEREEQERLQREREHQERILKEEQERLQRELAKHLENKQFQPAKDLLALNDATTKTLFDLPNNFFKNTMLEKGTGVLVQERNKTKKKEELQSAFKLFNADKTIDPPNEYDRAVLNYLCTEYLNGNRYITFAIIQRGISGKTGRIDWNHGTSEQQAAEIEKSVSKLMSTEFKPHDDTNKVYDKLNYAKINIRKSSLLPACIVRATINGQEVDAVYMDRISPLYQLSNVKNQILRFPIDLLDVPNQNSTPLVIVLKNYCVRRVVECIKHKMTQTLTLDDIFRHCRITKNDRKAKENARNTIDKTFAHLQKKGVIKSYEWRKKDGKFDAITFVGNPKFFKNETATSDDSDEI